MALKPLANTVNIGTASNVYNATAVYVVAGSATTVTIANTAIDTGNGLHGNYAGGQVSVYIPAGTGVVLRKRPMDTVAGSGCYGTKVAEGDI